jgi:hypothetical protein
MQQPTSTPTLLSPEQIWCRVVDYDTQVRQGLEDGTIRQVMKQLGPLLVSPVFLFFFPAVLTTYTHSGNTLCISEGYAH